MRDTEKAADSLLDQLYFGEIRPFELDLYHTPEMLRLREAMIRCQTAFEASLTPEQLIAFRDYEDHLSLVEGQTLEIYFKYGFRMGARLMMEVLQEGCEG